MKGIDGWNQGVGLIDRLFSVARPGAVFGEPVTAGEHTVITASEVTVSLGFGGTEGSEQATGEGEAQEEDGGVGGELEAVGEVGP